MLDFISIKCDFEKLRDKILQFFSTEFSIEEKRV